MARWLRLVGLASGIALTAAMMLVLPPLLSMLPRPVQRAVTEGFLRVLLIAYVAVLACAVPGAVAFAVRVYRARRRGVRRPWAARGLLLCASCLVGLVLLEASAVAWRAWVHRMPALPTRFAAAPGDEVSLVVIGESSAQGEPYRPYISIGPIVGWQLGRAIPGRRFRVDVRARVGATLEDMHQELATLSRRPDMMIIYAGHNEFLRASSRIATC